MSFQNWLFYFSVAATFIIVPGPFALLCFKNGGLHGSTRTLATIAGGTASSMTLMLLSAIGLGAVLETSDTAFIALKVAGAVYLVFIGVTTWRTRPMLEETAQSANTPASGRMALHTLFTRGYAVGLGNPKDLLFFGALFPQFLDPAGSLVVQLMILALTWTFIDAITMFTYATLGSHIHARLQGFSSAGIFHRISGGAFVAAGFAMALVGK